MCALEIPGGVWPPKNEIYQQIFHWKPSLLAYNRSIIYAITLFSKNFILFACQTCSKMIRPLEAKSSKYPKFPLLIYLWIFLFGYEIDIKSIENCKYNIIILVKSKTNPWGIYIKNDK